MEVINEAKIKQVKYESKIMTTQKGQATKFSARDFKNLCTLPENSVESLRSKMERYWVYPSMRIDKEVCRQVMKQPEHGRTSDEL